MRELPSTLQRDLVSWRSSTMPSPDDDSLSRDTVHSGQEAEPPMSQSNRLPHSATTSTPSKPHVSNKEYGSVNGRSSRSGPSTASTRSPLRKAVSAMSISPFKTHANAKDVPDIDPAASRAADDPTPLRAQDFYALMGMIPPNEKGMTPKSLEAAHGLYGHIRTRERLVERKYRAYDVMVTSFLVAQLMLSAVFIILGAINAHHITVAVLGGVSSLVTGSLALVNGQGLPSRLRMERDALRKVIFEAEEMYWDMRAGREVLFKDIKKVREAYLKILEDAAKSHPEQWAGMPTAPGQQGAPGQGSLTNPLQLQTAKPTMPSQKL